MTESTFQKRVESRDLIVGIVGLGYVGLPLVREFMAQGFPVVGFDIDPSKINALRRGETYIKHLPARAIAEWNASGRFTPTDDADVLSTADAILICVPTPLTDNREPEMKYVVATAEMIGDRLRPGQLVVLESTTWPGTTEELVTPILGARSGLRVGKDVFVAFSPEREDPGNPTYNTRTIPKVVGGKNAQSLAMAEALYGAIIERVVPVSSCAVAEAVKLTENIFRAVNIALVNELKLCYEHMGIDVWEVIDAASTKPFGYMRFTPGPGLGGHCLPIDPFYLTWRARQFDFTTRFIELAGEVNTAMPMQVVHRVILALNDDGKALRGARILVLGVAYKPNVDDMRESPALPIMARLQDSGADVHYHDPHIATLKPTRHFPNLNVPNVPLDAKMVAGFDAVLIVTDHKAVDYQLLLDHAPLIIDTRNACANLTGKARVVKA